MLVRNSPLSPDLVARELFQAVDLMSSPVLAVTTGAALAEAIETMLKNGFTTLPVVDERGLTNAVY